MAQSDYHTDLNTSSARIYLKSKEEEGLSFWHDIPLKAGEGVYHMVVEIPKGTRAKMEIATKEGLNPIRQDERNGRPRYVHHDYPYKWNYGALPQTWEDPSHEWFAVEWERMDKPGDNDPLDVIDIGGQGHRVGDVIKVKILGVLAMLDGGEVDWKLVACDVESPYAGKLNSIDDVRTVLPSLLDETREWLRCYKIPDGKPKNAFAFGERFLDKDLALRVIDETHDCWQKLRGDHQRMQEMGLK